MKGQMTEQKITIKDASHILGVCTKTIQRYLAKGDLTRIKEGTRTLLILSEVKNLKGDSFSGQGRPILSPVKTSGSRQTGDTVTLGVERYEQLLLELGELRKQNQFFMELKGMLLARDEAIQRLARDVEQLRERVHALQIRNDRGSPVGAKEEVPGPSNDQQKTTKKQKKPWWQV